MHVDQHELMLSLDTMDSSDKTQPKGNSEKVVVLPSEIFLVNLHGDVYCVELGSLGSGQGIGLTKLDKEAGCIHVRQLVSVPCIIISVLMLLPLSFIYLTTIVTRILTF